jgi:hypothetical protein
MRRAFLITLIAGLVVAFSIREYRLHRKAPLEEAYVVSDGVTVWNSTSQIRSPIANLTYGQPVQVYQRDADYVLVGTSAGIRGWVSSVSLMEPDIWRRVALLSEATKSMQVQAVGHTRARANIHTRPGVREPVIFQAPGDSPLVVLRHGNDGNQSGLGSAEALPDPTSKDYWLIRARVKNVGDVSGWMLGRLVALDLPEPLPEYQSSEAMTIVAWFEINHALDSSSGSERPEYLVAGIRDANSQPSSQTQANAETCDFNVIRIYTWSAKRHQYETAFIDGGFCGRLPLNVTPATTAGGDAYFSFSNVIANSIENRAYHMKLTTVWRIDASADKAQRKIRHAENSSARRGHT